MPRFLTVAEVEELHSVGLTRHQGKAGLRDPNGLASAVFAPQQLHFYELEGRESLEVREWALLAAAYWYHIAQGQVFADGNKRAGFMAAKAFLLMNGYTLLMPNDKGVALSLALANMSTPISRTTLANALLGYID